MRPCLKTATALLLGAAAGPYLLWCWAQIALQKNARELPVWVPDHRCVWFVREDLYVRGIHVLGPNT